MTKQGESVLVMGGAVGVLGVIVIPLLEALDLLKIGRDSGGWPRGPDLIGVAFMLAISAVPSALVAVGAYLLAESGKPAGRVMVSAGGFILIALFLLITFCGGYAALYLFWPRLLLTLMAALTWVAAGRALPKVGQRRGLPEARAAA